MKNYSEIPKFNTIANINLTFITEVILATVRINVLLVTIHDCFFFFFFFFVSSASKEIHSPLQLRWVSLGAHRVA